MKIKVLIIITNDFNNIKNYNYFETILYTILEKYFEKDYEIILREQETQNNSFIKRFAKDSDCKIESIPIEWEEML